VIVPRDRFAAGEGPVDRRVEPLLGRTGREPYSMRSPAQSRRARGLARVRRGSGPEPRDGRWWRVATWRRPRPHRSRSGGSRRRRGRTTRSRRTPVRGHERPPHGGAAAEVDADDRVRALGEQFRVPPVAAADVEPARRRGAPVEERLDLRPRVLPRLRSARRSGRTSTGVAGGLGIHTGQSFQTDLGSVARVGESDGD